MARGTLEYGPGVSSRRVPSERVVRTAVIASLLSTIVHYTDNYLNLEDYPQPHWIDHAVVPTAWVLLTAIGLLGYVLYRRERFVPAALCLIVYSYTGISSLFHYRYGPLSAFSPKMHAGIWFDGVTGAAVLAVAVWMLVAARSEPRRS
jgi:hypothetical protein